MCYFMSIVICEFTWVLNWSFGDKNWPYDSTRLLGIEGIAVSPWVGALYRCVCVSLVICELMSLNWSFWMIWGNWVEISLGFHWPS